MMINETSKNIIYFRDSHAKRVGKRCYYMDWIVWLNGAGIEISDDVRFNVGCYVNGYGGLVIGERSGLGPYSMVHTANHVFDDPDRPIADQGWVKRPVAIGRDCWFGMGVVIVPGVTIGDGVVVGAGSVVADDLPSWTVAVGNPARVVKHRRQVA
ncbi:MAG: acyltransferase [bacterium]|nr:acyltransferase [bacterium]